MIVQPAGMWNTTATLWPVRLFLVLVLFSHAHHHTISIDVHDHTETFPRRIFHMCVDNRNPSRPGRSRHVDRSLPFGKGNRLQSSVFSKRTPANPSFAGPGAPRRLRSIPRISTSVSLSDSVYWNVSRRGSRSRGDTGGFVTFGGTHRRRRGSHTAWCKLLDASERTRSAERGHARCRRVQGHEKKAMVCPVCIGTALATQGPALLAVVAGAGAGARAVRRTRQSTKEACENDGGREDNVSMPKKDYSEHILKIQRKTSP